MEMTEAIIPSFPLGEVSLDHGIKPTSLEDTSEEFPVKRNACEGMEMTEALSSVLGTMAPRHNIENPQDLVDPTEAMPSVLPHKSVWNVLHTEGVINPKKSTRKSLLNSEAMEMTEAITPSFPPGAVLNDSGMELTKAINRLQPTSEPENRSRCFQQDGMDLTEAIPPHVPVQELNMSYHNYFMELTEAIPSLKRSHAIISTSGNSTSTSPCSKSPKGLFSQEEPSQKDKNALHHLLHPDSPKLSSELQNQSMEFTRPVRPQHLKNVVNNDSVEMTECSIPLIPISEKRTPSETIAQCNGHFQENPLKDITYRIHPRPAVPTDISGTESSDSFKENRTPPDYPSMHPVARPLFEGPSEDLSYSSPVPLESEDFAESIRSSAVIGVRNLEDVCMELTEAFTKPGDHGALGSSDLQNIEAPSFMFEDSASVNRSDDSKLLRAAMQIGDQEMAGDFRSVPVPEAEFTEDISNFQFRKNGEDVQRNQMEDESSRNCRSFQEEGIPETSEDGQEASTGHETHIILRHKKEEKKMIKQVGNKQILVIESQSSSQSMEVDGEMRVEMFDETVVMCQEKVPNLSLEEKLSGDGENESQEKENCALVDTSDEPKKEVLGGAVYAAYVAHLARVHEENDVIMKSIKRQRKMEEVDRQKLAEMQNKETDSSKTSGIDPQEEDDLELTPFELMKKNLEERASRHCMWILCRCTEEKVFIEFKKTAFVFGIIFVTPVDDDGIGMIRDFYKVPRMADTEIPFRRILDPLMMEKINVEELRMKYSTYADVLPLLEAVSQDARFIYDFYENLVRLSFRDVVKVTMEKISFHVSTASMDTILEVFVNVKPFHQITPDDVYVKCNLGNVRKSHIKALINNVSKTPKFLTMYRNEIKDYIELMELASNSKK
ncbi:uncharacterized protein [Fopius arisanus]|uniref:Uncharacterized protein n=1 Tax=Fopius arisanus TaxID=64838 RepID=A0A9R1SZD1_9HYME|nr:PREDICTED: uncharacterized protein LOC105264528 [Fopius arisanus]